MRTRAGRDEITLPSYDDGFVGGAIELIGGPPGRHAALGRTWWLPVRIVLGAVLLTLFVGWAYKAPCHAPGADWGESQFQYRHLCYTDIYPLYGVEGFATDSGFVPYRDVQPGSELEADGPHYLEYPVGIGGVMWLSAEITELLPEGQRKAAFFNITALLLGLAGLGAAWGLVQLAGRRPWDAALFALAPALALHAFTNWDLAALVLGVLGLVAWQQRRPGWAGVLLGLGVATKMFPAFLLVALVLLALRSTRAGVLAVVKAGAVAVAVVAAVNLPVLLAWRDGWGEFLRLNRERPADWDSLWFQLARFPHELPVFDQLKAVAVDTPTLNRATAVLFALCVVLIAWLVATAPRRARVAQIAFLVTLAFLLVNKVWSPQFTLWLLPLAVLARPRWGWFLVWQVLEVALWTTRLMHFYDNSHPGEGVPLGGFFTVVLARDVVLLVIAALVVRDIRRPSRDPVRRDHDGDDPAAGALGAERDEPAAPLFWRIALPTVAFALLGWFVGTLVAVESESGGHSPIVLALLAGGLALLVAWVARPQADEPGDSGWTPPHDPEPAGRTGPLA